MRGGQTLSPDTDPRLTLHDNGSLAINDLQADDRGTYRVTVANTGGSDFHEFEVRVNCELGSGGRLTIVQGFRPKSESVDSGQK